MKSAAFPEDVAPTPMVETSPKPVQGQRPNERGITVSIKTHQSRVCSSLTESRKSAAIPTGKGRFAGRKCPAERTQNRSDGIGTGRNDESPAIARSSITVELHPSAIEIRLLGGRDLHEDRNRKMVQLAERLRFHQAG